MRSHWIKTRILKRVQGCLQRGAEHVEVTDEDHDLEDSSRSRPAGR